MEEFAYVASHDLQEPLRMVNIYADLLVRRFAAADETAQGYAHYVREGVSRMQTLIRDLLSYSRSVQRDEVPVGTASLSAALSEALSVLKPAVEECAAVINVGELPDVHGDTTQLAHVFQNLLSNSLKYRNQGVSPTINISAQKDGTRWIIAVQDNGIGFEQQYAQRIFGLFKRLHQQEFAGTGLGLAICQRIIERFHGQIWAEGTPGEGATFYFSLLQSEVQ
jgi:light-regulated signal transduction histidine kinase (bacteriophytochrome)